MIPIMMPNLKAVWSRDIIRPSFDLRSHESSWSTMHADVGFLQTLSWNVVTLSFQYTIKLLSSHIQECMQYSADQPIQHVRIISNSGACWHRGRKPSLRQCSIGVVINPKHRWCRIAETIFYCLPSDYPGMTLHHLR